MDGLNGDQFTYQESTASASNQPVYTSKQWAYQIDQNNGSYGSKQVIFDLSGFYNSQRFINPQEMILVLPVVSTLTAIGPSANRGNYDGLGAAPKISNDVGTSYNDNDGQIPSQYWGGYKSGYWHLISSMQIQVDGKDVIQLTPNIGYHASFVANTSWSKTDVEKYGSLTGFIPDSAASWRIPAYQNPSTNPPTQNFTADGYGVCNNRLPPAEKFEPYPGMQCLGTGDAGIAYQGARGFVKGLGGGVSSQILKQLGVNEGFWKRMQNTNVMDVTLDPAQKTAWNADAPALNNTNNTHQTCSAAQLQAMLTSYQVGESTIQLQTTGGNNAINLYDLNADANSTIAYRQLLTTCVVRFKDVCDLFARLPLTRGLYMRVTMNMNTGNMVIGANNQALITPLGAGQVLQKPAYGLISQSTFPGTCPLMLSPMVVSALSPTTNAFSDVYPNVHSGISNDIAPITTLGFTGQFNSWNGPCNATNTPLKCGTSNIQLYPGLTCDSATIARTQLCVSVSLVTADPIHAQLGLTSTLQSHKLSNCRIYAPIIDMEPALTNSYITTSKDQAIYYRDVLQFLQPSVPPQQQYTFQIANGLVNAKRLIILPFYHNDGAGLPFEPVSPFDSAPATVAPQNANINFNILISNMNVFQRQISYGFENFIEEIAPANAINGGLDIGAQSGLIDQFAWQNSYNYYVVDLSRRLAGDNTPKSLTAIGTNASNYVVDYYYFVEYERHLQLDIESGHISVSSN